MRGRRTAEKNASKSIIYRLHEDDRKWNWFILFLLYTAIFGIMYHLCWGQYYWIANKTTIWEIDGLEHGYSTFVYTQKYIRHILKNIFVDHNFVIPSWDYSIGYGSSVYATFSGMHNPLRLILLAIVPFGKLEGIYQGITIVRLYGVGASFIVLAKVKNKSNAAALAGALIYSFSVTTSVCLAHSEFGVTFLLMPLVLLAVDDLWKKDFSVFYVVILTIAIYDSFYYFFMMSIAIFMYCAHKYIIGGVNGHRSTKVFFNVVFRFLYHSIIAAGVSALSLLPVILNMQKTDRLGIERVIPFLYDKNYYASVLQGFVDAYDSGNDWYIGFSAISLIFVILLFTSGIRKHILVKLAFVEMTIGMCIPFVGHAMNGFSYSSNRWVFMYLLCIAYIVTCVIDEFDELSQKMIIIAAVITILYSALVTLIFHNRSKRQLVALMIAFVSIVVLWGLVRFGDLILKVYREQILVLLCAVSLFVSAQYHYNPSSNYHINTSVTKHEANNLLLRSGAQELLSDIDKTEGSRYDFADVYYKRNANWAVGNGHSSMGMYINLYNNNIDLMNKHLAIMTEPFNFSYRGVDERTELDALYGVKYFIVEEGAEDRLPVSYDQLYKNAQSYGTSYSVYQPSEDVSMAYLFDKAISEDEYMSLEPLERQQILMQAVVVDEANSSLDELSLDNDEVLYTSDASSSLTLKLDSIVVEGENNQLVLNIEKDSATAEKGEWYVYFKNYQNVGNTVSDYFTRVEALDENGNVCGSKRIWAMTSNTHMYGQKHDWLVNLGSLQNCKQIRILLETPGVFSLDDLKIYHRSDKEIVSNIQNLQSGGEISLLDNKMVLDTNTDSEKYLFISEPYNDGWTATIDGEKAQIMIADDAFMAIRVPQGSHNIVLRYHTPWMWLAIMISICSAIVYVVIVIMKTRRKTE